MTFNCSVYDLLARNANVAAQDDTWCVYLYVHGSRASMITETSRTVSSCSEAIPLLVDYDLGFASSPAQATWKIDNRAELARVLQLVYDQHGGSFSIDISEADGFVTGICCIKSAEGSCDPIGVLQLTRIKTLQLPPSPLKFKDDRFETCTFDRERWAQCTLKVPGRVLADLPDPANRYMFCEALTSLSRGGSNPMQSYVGDKFRTKEEAMAIKPAASVGAKTEPSHLSVEAPSAPPTPVPPTPPAPLRPPADRPVAQAVAARKAAAKTMSIVVPPVPAQEPSSVDFVDKSASVPAVPETAETAQPVAAASPVSEEEAAKEIPVAAPSAAAPTAAAGITDSGNGKEKRPRRSSETLDAEAAERLTERHWTVLPPVDDLKDKLRADLPGTVTMVGKFISAAEDAARTLRDAMFFEMQALCSQPAEPPIDPEELQRKVTEAVCAALQIHKIG